ncbi:hypothetical protein [Roseovarius aestuariivivens]|uniref:hypothetical protein n=1 Tax=Roseovarius aestuariivivens TaxID=1888910 RepID=UPI001080BA19|nr:hypothetical protein [Roseovarius aestuariivivens]
MDIAGIVKQYATEIGRFLRHQFRVWLGLIRQPVKELAQVDLTSGDALTYSLGLAAFVYLVCLAIALPPQFAGTAPQLPDAARLVIDAITTFLGFASVGASLWVAGRLLGSRASAVACFSTGFFMTAAWPFLQLGDWVLSGGWQMALDPVWRLGLFAGVFVVVTACALWWATPIVAHVHRFGRVRAVLATLLQLLFIVAVWTFFLEDRFPALGAAIP